MTRQFTRSFAAIAFAVVAFVAPAIVTPAAAQDNGQEQEVVKATHGAWDVVCNAAKPEECVIRQVGETADGKRALVVRVRKLEEVKTQDGKSVPGAIQITTPLGSLLRAGVKVKVDSGEPRTGVFEVCVPAGCVVRDVMSEDFLSSLKAGSVAKMSFALLQQGTLDVNVSLKGFTKAFNQL